MTEQSHSPDVAGDQPQPVAASTPKKRSRFGTFLKWMLIVFLVMQIVMRTLWEPVWGDALENLITYSQIQLSVICILIWWFFFSPFPRKIVLAIGLPVFLLLVVWIASIRSIDFDGDMNANIKYRWEKTAGERLTSYREANPGATDVTIGRIDEFTLEDVPAFRGIHRDGVVIGPELRTNWESNPPTELWRHPIGGGYSSFSVVAPVAVTMEQRGEDEAVVCYDTETGREFWEHRYPASFNALGGPGPRSTPTIYDNAVYSFGCFGDLYCLDLQSGVPIWHVNVLQQFGLPTTHWGMTSSPLIHEDKVIVNPGGLQDPNKAALEQPGNGLVAYRPKSGEFVWKSEGLPEPNLSLSEFETGTAAIEGVEGKTLPGYSSPMLATLADEEVILNFDGTAMRGHSPETGEQLWDYPFVAGDYVNVAQPLVFDDNRVLISAGYGAGAVMLQIQKNDKDWSAEELWATQRLRCKFSSPILYEGYIYGLDEGIMVCIDPEDGNRLWKGSREGLRGRYGHGQMLLVDQHIVILTEKGDLVLMEPSPNELKEQEVITVLSDDVKTWNPLAIAYGKAFVRNASEVACYDLRKNPDESSDTDPSKELAENSGD